MLFFGMNFPRESRVIQLESKVEWAIGLVSKKMLKENGKFSAGEMMWIFCLALCGIIQR